VTVPADPRLGTRLAGYRIQSLLDRGGMGVVYLAEQLGPHRPVALKLLSAPVAAGEAFRERFLRESELAAAIDHPNVLPVYDAGETDGALWIAMRYVDGIDLAALLARDGPLVPEQALGIGGQVAGALDAAHVRGLVHRDVKPANILLAVEDGVVAHAWLADFGLTRRIGGARGLTVSGQVLGTIDYVAPEQVEGGPVDGRADQYALGGVLFECLTGVVPFRRDGELAVLWAHVHDPPPHVTEHRPDLPAALDDVTGRALAKAPGDRYPSCEALVPTAQAALTGTTGRPAPPPRPGRRASRRTRPTVWAALADPAFVVGADHHRSGAVGRAAGGRRRPGPGRRRAHGPDHAGGAAGGQPRRPHRPGHLRDGQGRPGRDRPGGGDRRRRQRLDRQSARPHRERDRPGHQPGPGDHAGVRVRVRAPDRQGGPGLAYASGSLWVANTAQRRVARTEPGADPTPIPVEGASPIAIVAAQDAVWVAARTQRGRGLLARIDAGAN